MLAAHRKLRWFGCFRYTVGKPADPPHWPERRDDVVEIHIQNHVTPDSPFGDRRRLAAWMQGLTADVEARVPHVTRIGTGSWLNASRHFLQVYPPAYAASLVRLSGERKAGLGTWGQFITRDLGLNEPRAQLLRAEQTFACPQAYGNCSACTTTSSSLLSVPGSRAARQSGSRLKVVWLSRQYQRAICVPPGVLRS